MKQYKTFILFLATIILVGFTYNTYALTGEEILEKVEATLKAPKDMETTAKMVLANLDGSEKEEREVKMWSAGEKAVVKFLSPASIKGIGLLKLSEDQMYLYLPAMNKIRMIQGSMKEENFQGTDFTYEEMAGHNYKQHYNAKLIEETEKTYVLELTKKPSSDRKYDKAIMTVDKNTFIPTKLELYKKDKKEKVLEMYNIEKIEGKYWFPLGMKMTDLNRKHFTEIKVLEIKVDQNLASKDVFSKRFLKERI